MPDCRRCLPCASNASVLSHKQSNWVGMSVLVHPVLRMPQPHPPPFLLGSLCATSIPTALLHRLQLPNTSLGAERRPVWKGPGQPHTQTGPCGCVQDAELMAVMSAADVDKNGSIDYEEFIVATMNLSKLEREAGCQEAFSHFDTDGDGSITRDEIRQGLKAQGEHQHACPLSSCCLAPVSLPPAFWPRSHATCMACSP